MDYLKTQVSTLRRVLEDRGDLTQDVWRLIDDICWYTPDRMFKPCPLHNEPGASQCEIAQVLSPERILTENPGRDFNNSGELPLSKDGAIIFGYSSKCPAYWGEDPWDGTFGSSSFRGSSTTDGDDGHLDPTASALLRTQDCSDGDSPAAARDNPPVPNTRFPIPVSSEKQPPVSGQAPVRPPPPDAREKTHMWITYLDALSALLLVVSLLSEDFYVKIASISVMITGVYYRVAFQIRPESSWYGKLARRAILGLLLAWCFFLSPAYVYTPTLLEL